MLLRSRMSAPRRGIILLVVLALITLFASIGVAFVYFAEQEATKAQDQKAGETIKLPDADLMLNYALKQLVYPTTNTGSALFKQSLLENMYGSSGINAYNGSGRRSVFNAAIDAATGQVTGQDSLFRINYQQFPGSTNNYNEQIHGSLNPTYTYPDHKSLYLAAVAANWTQPNFPTYTQHGPVAIARSFAREIKFRVNVRNTTLGTIVGTRDIVLNPYTNFVFPGSATVPGSRHQDFWQNPATLFVGDNYLPWPLGANEEYVSTQTVTCNTNGSNATIILNPIANPSMSKQSYSLRPVPYTNSAGIVINGKFPPPGDLGGDVKNLPPEVKTLVGWNGTTPVFANNDSYWIDMGFPAMPYSNNRKIKPLLAVTIMDNDGKMNMNTAGNLRGKLGGPGTTFHASSTGLGPWEVNPATLITAAELQAKIAGNTVGSSVIRGNAGINTDQDPTTVPTGYRPLLRGAPFYSFYNVDGTRDGNAGSYDRSPGWNLAGDALPPPYLYERFPIGRTAVLGYSSAGAEECARTGAPATVNSPLFLSPYAPPQVYNTTAALSNSYSTGNIGNQRTFPLSNQEALYRSREVGADKIDSDLRKLVPSLFTNPSKRWQSTVISSDMNTMGISPWFSNATGDFTLPTTPPGVYPQPFAASVALPNGVSPNTVEYAAAPAAWRSIFGNLNRVDLARQLPDYPLSANNDTQLDLTNPLVMAQYKLALNARQKLAAQIIQAMTNLTHPSDDNTKRWIAQLAVNIVDYIDNDDYPTWYNYKNTPAATATYSDIVWGTELPRLLLNEVYTEAIDNPGDPHPGGKASEPYAVRHWAELYNPLATGTFADAWRDDANVRLNIGLGAGTSVYRLLVTRQTRIADIRNPANTLGYPGTATPTTMTPDTTTQTQKVRFLKPFTPATAVTVLPSDSNYGTAQQPTVANPNPGFFLVGPPNQPQGTSAANFPANTYDSAEMEVKSRIALPAGMTPRFDENANDNRQAILLQRLANPYLPYNPVPGITGELHDVTVPYNPYITIDYVENLTANHAVQHNQEGNPDDQNGNPLAGGPEARRSVGKMQPYSGINSTASATVPAESTWQEQRPDRDTTNPAFQALQNQPQHTFLRHNGVESNFPIATPNPLPNVSGLATTNTLRLPFEWLTHLDRAPTSPAELLHVSGFKPHELTQQFNRMRTIDNLQLQTVGSGLSNPSYALNTATSSIRLAPLTAGVRVNGSWNGIPQSLKIGDHLRVTFATNATGTTTTTVWARVTAVDNATATGNYAWVECITGNIGTVYNPTGPGSTNSNSTQAIVPFAHYAPWYVAETNVANQSQRRIYRFLETVSVRNPGLDVGQIRFTAGLATAGNTNTAGYVGPLLPDGSRWIQLDNVANSSTLAGSTHMSNTALVTVNDALLKINEANITDVTALPLNANPTDQNGDLLVLSGGIADERVMILQIDHTKNCVRVVSKNLATAVPAAGGTLANPLFLDYAYVSGRQPGRINLNTMWDIETWQGLTDPQQLNWFYNYPGEVNRIFRRIYQQRQPGFFYTPRMVGSTGVNGVGEDRPFQGMAPGDISAATGVPTQGIGNTFLSDRYSQGGTGAAGRAGTPGFAPPYGDGDMNSVIPGAGTDLGDNTADRFLRTLFEVGNPGVDHPYRRFELLSKIWNNSTVRSNTFSVWITIGFFEYDETTGLGAELGQIQGKNVRYRFFAVVDRSSIDSWLNARALHDNTTSVANFNFSTLDPRYQSYPPEQTAVSLAQSATYPPAANQYKQNPATLGSQTGNAALVPGLWTVNLSSANPFSSDTSAGRLVQVESAAGLEIGQIESQSAGALSLRLALNHTGVMTIRPLPVPPTVLYWSQFK